MLAIIEVVSGKPKRGYSREKMGEEKTIKWTISLGKEALLDLTNKLRVEFGQSTLLLEIVPAEVYYDREENG